MFSLKKTPSVSVMYKTQKLHVFSRYCIMQFSLITCSCHLEKCTLGAMEWLKTLTYSSVSKAPPQLWCLKAILLLSMIFATLYLKLIKFFQSEIIRFEFPSPSSLTKDWFETIHKVLGIYRNALRKILLLSKAVFFVLLNSFIFILN